MDQPGLHESDHNKALLGLARINHITGTSRLIWSILKKCNDVAEERPLKVLDVACGGGDVIISLACQAEKRSLNTEFYACDISNTALDHARKKAESHHLSIDFFQCDVTRDELPREIDVVYTSLFLHHLSDSAAIRLLQSMKQSASQMMLVHDLVRSRLGYFWAWSGVHLLTRSHICHVDGPLSVRAAFTPEEIHTLTEKAGLENYRVTRHWPERFSLMWCRDE